MSSNLRFILHGIKNTYPNFVSTYRLAARTKILAVSDVMLKLEDDGQKLADSNALSVFTKNNKRWRLKSLDSVYKRRRDVPPFAWS